ncbi:MAG TPA: CHASE4 domain-containing protein [Steroidobacteraceae bacterium]
MKIRPKIGALLAGLFIALGAVQWAVQHFVLLPSFGALERDEARTAIRRIDYALSLSLDQLQTDASDWGNWADAYKYVVDHNDKFARENLTTIAVKQLDVNVLAIVDLDGRLVWSRALSTDTSLPLPLDLVSQRQLPAEFPWRKQLREGSPAKGLLSTNLGILMIAGWPILDGQGGGPSRGMVLMGHLLDGAALKHIGTQAQVKVSMAENYQAAVMPGAATAADNDQLTTLDKTIVASRAYKNIYGQPAMTLRVDLPRTVSQQGHKSVNYAGAYLIGSAAIVLVVLLLVLNRTIVAPLTRVTQHAVRIGNADDLTVRLNSQRRDEIGVLATQFDKMVDQLASSRRALLDQSYQSGIAEQARGVLHNIGNAMTPLGVRLQTLQARLRAAPTEDVELAVTELGKAGADPARRDDLIEFLRLASGELSAEIRQADSELSVMQRQTAVVQSALTEQMRSSPGEPVLEAVRLPDLVAQSLEIVPDSRRQRLSIELDPSLQAAGAIRAPRMVLRLVLQNLIINAAEAIAADQTGSATLHIGCEITEGENGSKLYLYCRDNAGGISPENLERIFEKRFSTKSATTNSGMGLHWCANALGALRGRIWATSDGPGKGATLHVIVPLTGGESASMIQAA